MSFANVTLAGLAAGFAAIAVTLYLLQRLRVRHREVAVVTTLFWREAVEESRARSLVKRFRHPFTYLFLLSIASLLWFAYADPKLDDSDDREYLLLLDGSASMLRDGAFPGATELLYDDVSQLPRDRTRVLFVGATELPLLLPHEHPRLLRERLAGLQPDTSPSAVAATIDRVARRLTAAPEHPPITLRIYGDAPVSPDQLARLPADLSLERATPWPDKQLRELPLVALGVTEAASNDGDKVDILIELRGAPTRAPILTLDGAAIAEGPAWVTTTRGLRCEWNDVVASGQRLRVDVDGTTFDRILPDRRPIRVAISDSLRPVLDPVLAADHSVQIVDGDADVAIRVAGEATDGATLLEFTPKETQEEAFLITRRGSGATLATIDDASVVATIETLGLDEIDATTLADAGDTTIALGVRFGDRREVAVWEDLLTPRFNFTQARTFPLFIAKTIRWLAAVELIAAEVRVGEPLAARTESFLDSEGRPIDAGGAPFVPLRAGDYRDASGAPLSAALITPDPASDDPLNVVSLPIRRGGLPFGLDLASAAILLAFFLLLIDGALHRVERIP